MSGYNSVTGVFELTPSKERYWFRARQDEHGEWLTPRSALQKAELEILHENGHRRLIRGHPHAIWEALSGWPSEPDHPVDDHRATSFNATDLACLVVPRLSAVTINRRLAEAGLMKRRKNAWWLTAAGKPFGHYVEFSKPSKDFDGLTRVIYWDLKVLDILGLTWPRPNP